MHTDDRADLPSLRRHTRIAQLAGASAFADPFNCGLALPRGIGDMDVAAEADDIAEAQPLQEGEQLLIAEAAIGQDGDTALGRDELGSPDDSFKIDGVDGAR
jgi:hypothetical protein